MATTVRNCAVILNQATAGNLITLYEPGKTPGNIDTGRVCGSVVNLMMVVAIHSLPVNTAVGANGNYLNLWSGKSCEVLLRHSSSSSDIRMKRIDFPSSSQEYTYDLDRILFGLKDFFLSPDSRLSIRMIDAGHGFLSASQFIRIYGSFSETNEDTSNFGILIDNPA